MAPEQTVGGVTTDLGSAVGRAKVHACTLRNSGQMAFLVEASLAVVADHNRVAFRLRPAATQVALEVVLAFLLLLLLLLLRYYF